jgi:hypothetical protein
MKSKLVCAIGVVIALFSGSSAMADFLIGTSVSGVLNFSICCGSTNFFDPASGAVPLSGFGNSAGPNNVVISASQIEFGSNVNSIDSFITANFTDNAVDITYSTSPGHAFS